MRKATPDTVRRLFIGQANDLLQHFNRLSDLLGKTKHAQIDLTQLSSTTFLSLYVAFERLLSDLFLVYINRDSSSFNTYLSTRIRQSITEKFGSAASRRVAILSLRHTSLANIIELIDPEGWNLTLRNADQILQKAQEWLVPAYRTRMNALNDEDKKLIDTARA